MTTRRNLLTFATGFSLLTLRSVQALVSPIAKQEVGYQDVPRGSRVCAQCVYFIFKPSTDGSPQSRCAMVAGPISPAGWCDIWSAKSMTASD